MIGVKRLIGCQEAINKVKQFPHDSTKDDSFFARGFEPQSESLSHGVVFQGCDRGHIESLSEQRSACFRERGSGIEASARSVGCGVQTHKSETLFEALKRLRLVQKSQDLRPGGRPNTGYGIEQLSTLFQIGRRVNRGLEVWLNVFYWLFNEVNHAVNRRWHPSRGHFQAILRLI